MYTTSVLFGFSKSKQIAFTAAFATLCFIGTYVTAIPFPVIGYFNLGDVFVLLSAWCLGPLYGGIAAAIGCALADVIAGFAVYVPATFIIKGADACVAYFIWAFLKNYITKDGLDFVTRIASAIVGEITMVLGYFLFEGVFLVGFLGACGSLVGNGLQGALSAVCAVVLVSALSPIKAVKKLFPLLRKNP